MTNATSCPPDDGDDSLSLDDDHILSLATLPHVVIRQILPLTENPQTARLISKRWDAIADDYVKKSSLNALDVSVDFDGRLNLLMDLPTGQTPVGVDRWMRSVPSDGDVLTRRPLHTCYMKLLPTWPSRLANLASYLETFWLYRFVSTIFWKVAIISTIIFGALTFGVGLLSVLILSRLPYPKFIVATIVIFLGNYFLSDSAMFTILVLLTTSTLTLKYLVPKVLGYLQAKYVPNQWVVLEALDRGAMQYLSEEEELTRKRLTKFFKSCDRIDVLRLRNLDRLRFAILRDCLGSVPIGRLEVEVFKSSFYQLLTNEADFHALASKHGVVEEEVVITESQLTMSEFHQLYQW